MTEKEVGEVGVAYVKAAKLDEGVADQRNICLDVTLCDALFKVCVCACLGGGRLG